MSKLKSRYPVLENLFNSRVRVKVLKFLFRNNLKEIGPKDLARRLQEPLDSVKKELFSLVKIGLIKKQ